MRKTKNVARGTLRIYLGAAPGVGKTFAMLEEAHRRQERGTRVVVGLVETYGRPKTAALLDGLAVLPRRHVSYRGASLSELDVEAVVASTPELAIIDELAHTNAPGSVHPKRWQDVEELLEAGIDVLSTVNIQHLESLNDVVARITGTPQRETIPDEIVRRADQIELVDMTPEALRRRMIHGNVYAPQKIEAALTNYFRIGNLTALRELALLWLADRVEEALEKYRDDNAITELWETRERVVVAVTGGRESETLIRRAKRIATRSAAQELLAVHVVRGDGLAGASHSALEALQELVENVGGTFHLVIGDDPPSALLEFARGANATQLVIGASRRPRWARLVNEGVSTAVIANSGHIDVHIVTHAEAAGSRGFGLPKLPSGLTARRRFGGFLTALVALPLLTAVLLQFHGTFSFSSVLLLFLGLVVAIALVGGGWPALASALVGSALVNWFFAAPTGTFTIAEANNVIALTVFVLVGLAVASVVELAARRARAAVRARAEAELLAQLSRNVLRGTRALPTLLEQVRDSFSQRSVTLLERRDTAWSSVEYVGEAPAKITEEGDASAVVSDNLRLVLHGKALAAADQRLLSAFAAQAGALVERAHLSHQAAEARALAEANKIRSTLLAAVGHDLRTPLSSIKAAISSLRAEDISLSPNDESELLATVDESADQLRSLIDNLLDASRLRSGSVQLALRPVSLDEVVGRALVGIEHAERVTLDISEDTPLVRADAGLLERALANVIGNAVTYGGGARIAAVIAEHAIEVRIIDHGPGIPDQDYERIFDPFERAGDRHGEAGIGLGLAVARGFIEAMAGALRPERTPGGGLTMVVSLPPALADPPPEPARRADQEEGR